MITLTTNIIYTPEFQVVSMRKHEDIVIVGGGPAGAYCALELSKHGIFPLIINYPHHRGKPCGGGISPIVIRKFPFLEKFRSNGSTFSIFKIISCTDIQVDSKGLENGFWISRKYLDREILNMAIKNGAKTIEERVLDVRKKGKLWNIKTSKGFYSGRILVGADGVNSIVRNKTIGSISRENLAITFGFIAGCLEEESAVIKFLSEIPGYIWVFPGKRYSNIGIGSELNYGSRLEEILYDFVARYYPRKLITEDTPKYAWMLPSARNPDFFKSACAGDDWLLVGDAAGHVDPVSGGGILYALWGGKLAAEAIDRNDPRSYDKEWRIAFGKNLEERCKNKSEFYDPLKSIATILKGLIAKEYSFPS